MLANYRCKCNKINYVCNKKTMLKYFFKKESRRYELFPH